MKKKIIIYTILGLVIAVGLGYFFDLVHHRPLANQMVLFYSKSCPHCRKVEYFIDHEDIMNRLPLVQEEVESNIHDVTAVAKQCHLNLQTLEIPLLWTGKVCVIGDQAVISHFKQQLMMK